MAVAVRDRKRGRIDETNGPPGGTQVDRGNPGANDSPESTLEPRSAGNMGGVVENLGPPFRGERPRWRVGPVCKTGGECLVGSNPTSPTERVYFTRKEGRQAREYSRSTGCFESAALSQLWKGTLYE